VIGSSLSVEAGFQAELYRLLKNLVAGKFSVDSVVFDNVEFERRVDSGRADIVIVLFSKPFIIIKTKRGMSVPLVGVVIANPSYTT
jgi:hypothetical protein